MLAPVSTTGVALSYFLFRYLEAAVEGAGAGAEEEEKEEDLDVEALEFEAVVPRQAIQNSSLFFLLNFVPKLKLALRLTSIAFAFGAKKEIKTDFVLRKIANNKNNKNKNKKQLVFNLLIALKKNK